jgi:hypothetical protein
MPAASRKSQNGTASGAIMKRELKAGGMGPTDIAKALKIGRASVYRVLDTTPS